MRTGEHGSLARPGGGRSDELSVSGRWDALNHGFPTNIPTLVKGQIGIEELLAGSSPTDEQIKIAVRRAAARVNAGGYLPAYETDVDAANAAFLRSANKGQ